MRKARLGEWSWVVICKYAQDIITLLSKGNRAQGVKQRPGFLVCLYLLSQGKAYSDKHIYLDWLGDQNKKLRFGSESSAFLERWLVENSHGMRGLNHSISWVVDILLVLEKWIDEGHQKMRSEFHLLLEEMQLKLAFDSQYPIVMDLLPYLMPNLEGKRLVDMSETRRFFLSGLNRPKLRSFGFFAKDDLSSWLVEEQMKLIDLDVVSHAASPISHWHDSELKPDIIFCNTLSFSKAERKKPIGDLASWLPKQRQLDLEWLVIGRALSELEEGGRFVGVFSQAFLHRAGVSQDARKLLVFNQGLSAIIGLPSNSRAHEPAALLVIDKKTQSNVSSTLIASIPENFSDNNNANLLSDAFALGSAKNDWLRHVFKADFERLNYVLTPKYYFLPKLNWLCERSDRSKASYEAALLSHSQMKDSMNRAKKCDDEAFSALDDFLRELLYYTSNYHNTHVEHPDAELLP